MIQSAVAAPEVHIFWPSIRKPVSAPDQVRENGPLVGTAPEAREHLHDRELRDHERGHRSRTRGELLDHHQLIAYVARAPEFLGCVDAQHPEVGQRTVEPVVEELGLIELVDALGRRLAGDQVLQAAAQLRALGCLGQGIPGLRLQTHQKRRAATWPSKIARSNMRTASASPMRTISSTASRRFQ
jgi:hypothetical protein